MSQNKELTNQTVTIDQLQHFWMPSGLPCFIADRDNICDIVENMGFNIYYLLANKITVKTITNPNVTVANNYTYTHAYNAPVQPAQPTQEIIHNSTLFKIINNYVGRVVKISDDELPETFFSTEEACEYTMPPIPSVLVDKLDQFFRLVHSQHGTESIVLLTYDTTKTGPEGWGILVPEQVNTPAHCKYDADSVAEIKPENVLIVGSVHSHPEMSAYASGTDHADQADFDGLHITYCWQKSVNNGATQHYFELQMSGIAYSLKAEDVFEDYTFQKQPDPDVVEWTDKVKKVLPPKAGGSFLETSQKTLVPISEINGTKLIVPAVGEVTTNDVPLDVDWEKMVSNLDPFSIVIAEIDHVMHSVSECPCCRAPINHIDIQAFACCSCDTPLISTSDSIFQISYKFSSYCKERKISPLSVTPYLFGYSDTNKMFIMKLNLDLASGPQYKSEKDDYDYVYLPTDDDSTLLEKHINNQTEIIYQEITVSDDIDPSRTICCNVLMADFAEKCFCSPAIFYEDLTSFEEAVRVSDIDLYSQNASCVDCANYYHVSCPAYRNCLINFIKDPSDTLYKYNETIMPCDNFQSIYNEFNYTQNQSWENYGV